MSVPATCRLIRRKIWGERVAADRDTYKEFDKIKRHSLQKQKYLLVVTHITLFICKSTWLLAPPLSLISSHRHTYRAEDSIQLGGDWCAKSKLMSIWENWHLFPLSLWKHKHKLLNFYFPWSRCRRRRNVARSSSTGCGAATRRWWQRCYHRKGVFMCSAIWVKLVLHGQLSFPVRPHSLSLSPTNPKNLSVDQPVPVEERQRGISS